VRGHVLPALVPDVLVGALHRLPIGARRDSTGAASVLRPTFASRIGWRSRSERLASGGREVLRSERAEHYRRLTWGLIPVVLEVADREARHAGVEPAYPFFDARLMELSLSLPPETKLRDGWTRFVLRRALDGVLPPEIQWRAAKANLAPVFRRGLARDMSDVVDRVLTDSGPLAEYVDLSRARAASDRFARLPTDRDAMTLWKVATLGVWLDDARVSA
jgi:asparagine synthase (glutamine-hydrolysing)